MCEGGGVRVMPKGSRCIDSPSFILELVFENSQLYAVKAETISTEYLCLIGGKANKINGFLFYSYS